jgi:hypothetical protein
MQLYRLGETEDPEEDAVECCPSCGSPDIEPVEWHGGTGVTAPDGYEERWTQRGYRCRACGAIEEE